VEILRSLPDLKRQASKPEERGKQRKRSQHIRKLRGLGKKSEELQKLDSEWNLCRRTRYFKKQVSCGEEDEKKNLEEGHRRTAPVSWGMGTGRPLREVKAYQEFNRLKSLELSRKYWRENSGRREGGIISMVSIHGKKVKLYHSSSSKGGTRMWKCLERESIEE